MKNLKTVFNLLLFSLLFLMVLTTSSLFAAEDSNAPNYQNEYTCGLFGSVLVSYSSIDMVQNDVYNTCEISVKDYNFEEKEVGSATAPSVTCYEDMGNTLCECTGEHCSNDGTCTIVPEPTNRYEHNFISTTVDITTTTDDDITFTELEYGSYTFTDNSGQEISFDPQYTYADNNRKVMLLGDIINAGNNQKMVFSEGDYYFKSWDMQKNQIDIEVKGDVRIFIEGNLVYDGNHANIETPGDSLFIYVGGDATFGSSGGGNSWIGTFLYVEGDAIIENSANAANFFGSLVVEGAIDIQGENINFIYNDSADSIGFGECKLCYDSPRGSNEMDFFMMSVCSPWTPCDMYVPIRNISPTELDDVKVIETQSSLVSLTWGDNYEVVDQDGNVVPGSSAGYSSEYYADLPMDFSIGLNNGYITYDAGDNYPTYEPDEEYYQMYKKIKDQINLSDFSELIYFGQYVDDTGRYYNVQLDPCEVSMETDEPSYTTGPFDAWDTFRNINDRNISTKVAAKNFNLTIASINDANTATETKNNIDIKFSLYNENTNSYISSWYDFNASSSATTEQSFNIPNAHKKVKVVFKVCADYSGTDYILYPYDDCNNTDCTPNDKNTSNNPCLRKFYSSDDFAIRPYAFRVFGKNEYKRAGEEFNLTIKAVDENNFNLTNDTITDVQGVADYNESLSSLQVSSSFYVPTDGETQQMNYDVYGTNDIDRSKVAYCPNSGSFSMSGENFADGEVNATLQFSETGILTVTVSEIDGNEFAHIDVDDTNDSQRFIKAANNIYDENDINKTNILLFIPYQFDTEAEYNTTTNKNWVYVSNEVQNANNTFTTPKMAAYLKFKITAKNKNGQTVNNYTKTCFPDVDETNAPRVNGLKLNSTFDLFLDFTLNSERNTTISLYTEDNASNAVWTLNRSQNLNSGDNHVQEWIGSLNFGNGIGEAKVYFNIDRSMNTPINPLVMSVADANTSTSWMSNPGATKIFNGENGSAVDHNISYLYARAKSSKDFYDNVTTTSINTPIMIQVYCNKWPVSAVNCPGVDIVNGQTNDNRWWLSWTHNENNGDGNITLSIGTVSPSSGSASVDTDVTVTSQGQDATINVTNTSGTVPMTVEIDLDDMPDTDTSPWLIYNPDGAGTPTPFYKVKFIGTTGWAGYGKTGHILDSNASTKRNRRLGW
jgi:hypothetical protein